MAYQFKANCPRCGAMQAGFSAICMSRVFSTNSVNAFAICGICEQGIIARFEIINSWVSSDLRILGNCRLRGIIPAPPSREAPKFTPKNVALFYGQGLANLHSRNFDAAGAMFRKSLETGLKKRFPSTNGNLFERIQEAAKQHELTPALARFAHHIRLEGNKAVHDVEPYSAEEAEDLKEFVELVLSYLYLLPGKLEIARQRITSRSEDEQADVSDT